MRSLLLALLAATSLIGGGTPATLLAATPVVTGARPTVPAGLVQAAVVAAAHPTAPAAVLGAGRPRRGYRWPLDGQPAVVRPFDPPDTPYGRGHRGVDLAAAPGAVVRSAGAGVVAFAGTVAGRGVVSIQHANGLRTTYEPVITEVVVGQAVAAGDQLGTLAPGHAGCSAAACLHWGLRRGDTYLDPLSLLGLGRVRLLPLERGRPGRAVPRSL